MSCKPLPRAVIPWLFLFLAYLRSDISIAVGQPAMPEVKVEAAMPEQEQIALLVGPARVNPFLSLEEEWNFLGPKEPPAPIVLDYFKLSAIFCSQVKTENKAIINGMICKVGDEVDVINSKKIVQIQPREVMLKDADGLEYLLRLNKGS